MSNDVFDKYGLIEDIQKKLEMLADVKGVLRCGLIWDISNQLKALNEGLKKDDEAHKQQIQAMKQMLDNQGV